MIEYMEGAARPFAQASATVARYDGESRLTAALVRAFGVIAEEPAPPQGGGYWTDAQAFRQYPLVLSLMAVVMVAVREKRSDLLRQLFAIRIRQERPEANLPSIVESVRAVATLEDFFRAALGRAYFQPLAERLAGVLPAMVRDLIPGGDPRSLFLQAEFVVALAYMDVAEQIYGKPFPLPGRYMHAYEARDAISALLRDGSWLQSLFTNVEERLTAFDRLARGVVGSDSVGRRDGFITGALELWQKFAPGRT